jgi:hypothetical protein
MASNSDAEFIGWQETGEGDVVALYVIRAKEHPLYKSTVSEKTLRRLRLAIPPIPRRDRERRRSDDEG